MTEISNFAAPIAANSAPVASMMDSRELLPRPLPTISRPLLRTAAADRETDFPPTEPIFTNRMRGAAVPVLFGVAALKNASAGNPHT